MSVIGSILAKLELDITNFSSNLSKVQSDIEATGKKLDGLSNLGNGLTSAGKTLTTSLTLPIVAAGAAATTVATEFEYSMSQVQAISQATGEDFEALRDQAIVLGGSTKYSATEVADAMTEMAKAGWTTHQILDGMSGVLDAAAASGESLGSVSTIVADAITGFGLEASDSSRIADLLTQAANSGTIGIADLGESFKYIAPVAQSMGFSVEDVTTAISAMSMAGIKGSSAGTSLRTMLTNLVKPTDAMAAAMEELGVEVANEDGTMKSLDDILSQMRSSFSTLTDEQKSYYAATLAGKTGMSGMLSLMNLTQDEYNTIASSMDNSSGVAAETAAVMQDNLKSALEQLGGAFESLAIRIGDQLVPIIRSLAEWITKLAEKLAGASEEQIQMGIKIAAVVAAIGPLLMIVGKLVSLIVTLQKAFTAVKAGITAVKVAMAACSAPIGAIAGVIGVLVAAFATLWKTNEEFRNKIIEIWNGLVGKFTGFFQGITDRLNKLGFDFENFGEVLKALWQGLCDFLAPIFIGVFEVISNVLGTILDVILGILDFFISVFTGDWEGAWEAVKNIFSSIWNGIVGIFKSITDAICGILDAVCGWFGTTWENTWNGISSFFVGIWNGIVSFFEGILNGIASFFKGIWNGIASFFTTTVTNIKNTVINIFSSIKNGISNVIGGIKDTIVKGFNKAIEFITSLPKQAITWGKDMIQGIIDGIKNMIGKIGDAVKGVANKIKSFIGFSVPEDGPLHDYEIYMPHMVQGLSKTLKKAAPQLYKTAETVASGLSNVFGNEDLQASMAGAYGSVSGGTTYNQNLGTSTSGLREAATSNSITIENIEVRDDDDIEELTQGLYNHNDKSLRAMGRRNL